MYTHIDLLSAAMGPEQDKLLRQLEEIWVEPGTEVSPHRGGQPYCFVVLDGFVRMHDPILGQKLIGPGGSFGLAELLAGQNPKRTYWTVSRSTLLGLSHGALNRLLRAQDILAQNLQAELARLAGAHAQSCLARLSAQC